MTLGEKIRDRRKALGLTQSALAEGIVTRNMLSRIESGTAKPSLGTLDAIAAKLGFPVSYFLSETESAEKIEREKSLAKARTAYREQRYADCVEALSDGDVDDPERSLLLSLSYFYIGRAKIRRGALESGAAALDLSEHYAALTPYPTEQITAMIPMWRAVAENVKSPLLDFDSATYLAAVRDSFDQEFFRYLTGDADYAYRNPLFAAHVKAKSLMKKQKFDAAIRYLSEAENYKNGELYNAYAMLSVYTDLEFCYRQLCDFEQAYRYSSKRISMMEGFKS